MAGQASMRAGAPSLAAGTGDWLQRAAVAHAVYTPEKRHPVEVGVEENQDGHLARWLTSAWTRRSAVRPRAAGLCARRRPTAARCPRAERAAHVREPGRRVTVYLQARHRASRRRRHAFRYERQGDLGLFYWVEGQADRNRLRARRSLPREKPLALAESIYAQGVAAPAPPSRP